MIKQLSQKKSLCQGPPTVTDWYNVMHDIFGMNKFTHVFKLKTDVFHRCWKGWIKYISPYRTDFSILKVNSIKHPPPPFVGLLPAYDALLVHKKQNKKIARKCKLCLVTWHIHMQIKRNRIISLYYWHCFIALPYVAYTFYESILKAQTI